MPGLRTLDEIVTQVRRRADMENTQFVTDAEIQQYVQDSYGELYDLIIANAGVDHFRATLDFSTIADQATYNLNDRLGLTPPFDSPFTSPKNVYKTIGMEVLLQGYYRPIRPGRRMDLGAPDMSQVWSKPDDLTYHLHTVMGAGGSYQAVTFFPVPSGVYSCRLHYIPSPADLAGEADSSTSVLLNSYSGWDEYVIVDAAAKCLEKEESDARHLYKRKVEVAARIAWHAQTMNNDGPGRVRNVDADPGWGLW